MHCHSCGLGNPERVYSSGYCFLLKSFDISQVPNLTRQILELAWSTSVSMKYMSLAPGIHGFSGCDNVTV